MHCMLLEFPYLCSFYPWSSFVSVFYPSDTFPLSRFGLGHVMAVFTFHLKSKGYDVELLTPCFTSLLHFSPSTATLKMLFLLFPALILVVTFIGITLNDCLRVVNITQVWIKFKLRMKSADVESCKASFAVLQQDLSLQYFPCCISYIRTVQVGLACS